MALYELEVARKCGECNSKLLGKTKSANHTNFRPAAEHPEKIKEKIF